MYAPQSVEIYSFLHALSLNAPTAFLMVGMCAALGVMMLLLIPVVIRLLLPLPKETRLSDHLPFDQILKDGRTIMCRDGTLFQVLELKGKEISFISNADRRELFDKRKRWFDSLSDLGIKVRIFTVRERRSLELSDEFDTIVLRNIAKKWNASFRNTFRNRHIVILSIPHPKNSSADKGEMTVYKKLLEGVDASLSMLYDFKPVVLDQKMARTRAESPIAFLAGLVSPITKPAPMGMVGDISDVITTDMVEFYASERGLIRFQSGDQEKFVGVMGIKQFGDFTDEDFIAALGSVTGEITILHVIEPWSKVKAGALLAQQGRMAMVTRFSKAAKDQFGDALEMIEGVDEHRQTMSSYQMIILAHGNSPEEVSKIDSQVRRACVNFGVAPVREGVAAQASWFAQFPSYNFWPRPYKLFSGNISSLVSFDSAPEGLPNSDWGPGPIAMFRTSMGTPYQFQFHVSMEKDAVAHGMIIGPTGGGKTTLISFLTGMALRHRNLRSYLFDRYLGTYVFTNAVGGAYMNVDSSANEETPGQECQLNPFQCEDTSENRAFLRSWLEGISDAHDSESLEEIGRAVKLNFEAGLPREQRSLRTLHEVAFAPDRPLSKNLRRWIDPQIYGNIFNAPRDTLDTGFKRLIAFDFTRIYASEDLTRAMLSYLMHRIQSTITERNAPALIFVDETEPLLKHPTFRDWFLKMLQEYRKRGAGVLSAFQRPEALQSTGVSELIRGQAQTIFFLRNPQAQEKDYSDFSLTEIEWNFIKGKAAYHLQRAVLIKRATGESVIVDTDLSVLGRDVRVFSSGRDSVRLAETLQRQYGGNWVQEYIDA